MNHQLIVSCQALAHEPFYGAEFMARMALAAAAGGGKAIRAEVPLAEMFGYSTTLRSLTQGRATYSMEFKQYAEAPKNVAEAIITARTK